MVLGHARLVKSFFVCALTTKCGQICVRHAAAGRQERRLGHTWSYAVARLCVPAGQAEAHGQAGARRTWTEHAGTALS